MSDPAPDDLAPRIIGIRNPLHHAMVTAHILLGKLKNMTKTKTKQEQ